MLHKTIATAGSLHHTLRHRIILLLAALALAPAFVGSPCGNLHTPQELGARYANRTPLWSADGQSIVVNLRHRIYRVSADGSSVTRIPPDGEGGQYGPALSPDGRIAYVDATEYTPRLTIVNSNGGRKKHHTWRGVSQIEGIPAWSPDGRYVAFSVQARNDHQSGRWDDLVTQSVMMNEKGSLTAVYQPPYLVRSGMSRPVWSNDGRQVAFSWDCYRRCTVTVMDTDGRGKTVVDAAKIAAPGQDEYQARGTLSSVAWSPDDQTIYYALQQGRHLPTILYSTNLSTLATRHIIDLGTRWIDHLAISPDGGKLVFVTHKPLIKNSINHWRNSATGEWVETALGWESGLFMIDTAGTGLHDLSGKVPQLQGWHFDNVQASWSPDGRRIAFNTTYALYTIAPDGSNFRQLTTHDAAGNVIPATAQPRSNAPPAASRLPPTAIPISQPSFRLAPE